MVGNPQVLGYWLGRLRDLISFAAEAATAYGVVSDGSTVKQKGWGLRPKADLSRFLRAFQDLRSFQSSLRLLPYKIGAWGVHWAEPYLR